MTTREKLLLPGASNAGKNVVNARAKRALASTRDGFVAGYRCLPQFCPALATSVAGIIA
jgi:hypothetical protein